MLKLLFTLYFTCYFCYIFYTREPDYFDGETTTAIVNINTATQKATADFIIASKTYSINANYPLRKLQSGASIDVIYAVNKPEKAVIYSFWGYWITWGELLMSIILLIALYQLAVSITKNPTEEAILDQMEKESMPKTKYD